MADGGLDFNKHSMKEAQASDAINDLIDANLIRRREKQERRAYLGASAIGGECERAMQFELAHTPKDSDFKPATLRKFDYGHMGEELARAWFQDAGFDLVQRSQRTGDRFRFVQMDDEFSGEPDGVFIAGPAVPGLRYPAMWECKSTGGKTFREIVKHGLKKARPAYWSQIHTCMAYLDLGQTVFTINNLDSGEQAHLIYELDPEEAQRMTDRAVRVITSTRAGELLPRPFADANFYICKGCFFVKRCWSLPS